MSCVRREQPRESNVMIPPIPIYGREAWVMNKKFPSITYIYNVR
jgi:hypothetical protein